MGALIYPGAPIKTLFTVVTHILGCLFFSHVAINGAFKQEVVSSDGPEMF